jgi:hypothetical protein
MGLRLIVYDATGHGRAPVQPLLTASWVAGVELYRRYPRMLRADASFGASSWTDALAWLCSVQPDERIDEIQYWGHGLPGRVMIAADVFGVDSLAGTSPHAADLDALAYRLHQDSLVWLRTCGAFAGDVGHAFAVALAARFGCRVAGHTFVIGPLQSGLHTLKPGQKPGWSTTEGLTPQGALLPSSTTAPNTISALHGRIPAGY